MKLVISMMTKDALTDSNIQDAIKILGDNLSANAKSFTFNYDDSPYCETDIDIDDFMFTTENFQNNMEKLIHALEQILSSIPVDIDVIVANDDTEAEILRYEKDWNDVGDFGLFVTKRTIPNLKAYYKSNVCNAYLNTTHVSFGIYDQSLVVLYEPVFEGGFWYVRK